MTTLPPLAALKTANRTAQNWVEGFKRISFFHYGDTPDSMNEMRGRMFTVAATQANEMASGLAAQIGGKTLDYVKGVAWHAERGNLDQAQSDAKIAARYLAGAVAQATPDPGGYAHRPRMGQPLWATN